MSSPVNITPENGAYIQAIISLGSNLGSSQGGPVDLLKLALADLQAMSPMHLITSSFYQTRPVDCPPGTPEFANAVTLMQVPQTTSASLLLEKLHAIEGKYGRDRGPEPNLPRTLDLDLISFGSLSCNDPELTLPHPRAHQRSFVMVPLAELLPNLTLPGQQLTVAELARRLGAPR